MIPEPYSAFIVPEWGVLRWWSVLLAAGVLAGAWVARWRTGRLGLDSKHALPLLVVAVAAGIPGARVYYLVFEWERRFADEPELAWQIWEGGVALHGALIGALLGISIYSCLARLELVRWIDAAAVGLPLGIGVARWGDYFNQQSFGVPTDLPWALSIEEKYRPLLYLEVNGFHPTFLYESVWALVVFASALVVARSARRLRRGDLALGVLAAYSVGRFWIESIRADPIIVGEGLRLAMIVSAAVATGGIGVLALRRWPGRMFHVKHSG
ncbi:MAG: prolipoprotein diacylglyceryl transferase [Chloroflexi bacterium]|nr:prolipoprotein diacylglyceryl transferase [Chloroflexota bacterium]